MKWCLEVWGDYACFTRPEMKIERVSYDVMTPSAARAIFEAIFWKPAIKWHITRIEVLNPIKWISVRRNEVGAVFSERSNGIFIEENRTQKAGLFLRDVRYRIYAWFEFIPPEKRKSQNRYSFVCEEEDLDQKCETNAKYAAIFERRAKKGQCFHRPYLGCREFACYFRLIEDTDTTKPININADLGWMLYDIQHEDIKNPVPEFFRAQLENGVLNTDRNEVEVHS